jgi:2-succinyl-5-enolpyruvyl-6-hydroxy-3-cyclohexene-1-carboxylate synthase
VEKTIRRKDFEMPSTLVADWNTSQRIMILVGTRDYSAELENQLSQLVKNHTVVVLSEANSNLHHEKFFKHIDRYIFAFSEEDFMTYAPDLLITVGQNVVSKKIKQFLRKAHPKQHWHIDEVWQPDTYFALTQKLEVKPEVLFSKLLQFASLEPKPYYNLWDVLRDKKDAKHEAFLNTADYSDFYFFNVISHSIPEKYNIHFSNSSAIRYAQLFDFGKRKIYCNRGTSGIDGCTSTAMGFAMKSEDPTLLITGDLSFLYDINGLWNQYIPPFTRIIIFNNGEGNIFKIIPGPGNANSNTVDEFIATKHQKNAEFLAKHFGFGYVKVEDERTLDRVLENFFNPDAMPKILEVMTQGKSNADIQKAYFNFLKS